MLGEHLAPLKTMRVFCHQPKCYQTITPEDEMFSSFSLEDIVQLGAGISSTALWVSHLYYPASPGSTAAISINSENDEAYYANN